MVPVVLALGCLAGLLWLALRRANPGEAAGRQFGAGLAALTAGLVGARLGFVAVHLPYFLDHPVEIVWVWEGGLSAAGGALGAVCGLSLYAAARRQGLRPLADAVTVPALGVALAAWVGCTLEGCVYGMNVVAGPLATLSPDVFGMVAPRWPTAAVGMVTSGALLAGFLQTERRSWPPGLRAALALAGVAATSLALSFTRADPALLLGGVRVEAAGMAVVLALASLAAAIAGFATRGEVRQ